MNPNLPVGGSALNLQLGAREALPASLTQLGLAFSYARFADEYRGSEKVHDDGPDLDAFITQLSLRHYFGQGFAADLALPAGTIIVEPGHGEPTRRLSGFGDLELGASYDFAGLWGAGGYQPSLTLRLGLGLPTGRQGTLGEEDPGQADGHGSVPPNVLAIGYGAYSGSAELRLTQFASRYLGVSPSVSLREPFGASESGLTMGGTYLMGLDVLAVPAPWLVVSAGPLLQIRTHSEEDIEGRILNSGGRAVFATASVSVRASERVAFGVGGRVPVHTNVQGQQISETFSLMASLSVSFGGEHEDEHEHEPPRAGDVRDAARGGESFVLSQVLAPGKITVIDFWATWCHACKHIDARLDHLSAKHPKLAVRRVEVPDFDSRAAIEHLPKENSLPQLWIFDGSGKRRATVTTLEDLERELMPLLRDK